MFTFIWADGQASGVESLKIQNSNLYDKLNNVTKARHTCIVVSYVQPVDTARGLL